MVSKLGSCVGHGFSWDAAASRGLPRYVQINESQIVVLELLETAGPDPEPAIMEFQKAQSSKRATTPLATPQT